MAERIQRFEDITPNYDVVLCDVWGVLHNGVDAFAEASDALIAARKAGATVVLLTNSPRPTPGVTAQLRLIGVPDEAYDGTVTSGDVTRKLIAEGPKKVFLLGPERDLPLIEGLGVERTSAEEAGAIVCSGFFDDERETPETYREMLSAFIARGVPMICANPDLVVERGSRIIPCAGAIAQLYDRLGGETRIAGKPHRPIYEAALSLAAGLRGGTLDKARVIAIGDGMVTDVRGALDHGLDLLYISGGIHAADYVQEGRTNEALLADFLARHDAHARYWMPRLA
ncbi:TIGR01459 family HAD-type hydrolase [Gellertiella hungarica]|uniref:HAD superfamily hydrolase (TIGR01450 family) n=1 Tax=Gellertiella hungarica TaxID=1572859 RepID=A0A7W6J3W5_9HYPH|nr:TIGR01459 family HAD-type hydrolase [Gellertiella hungarica]MBB4064301.1 HAD superfamily hydrolase (TIGR01450 family) [Gellertiella hungarica]